MVLDEFRIYNGGLTANEIAASQVLGPNQLLSQTSPTMNTSLAGTNFTLYWPLAAAGFTVMSCTNLASGVWSPFSAAVPQIVGNQWQIALPISGDAEFFRLVE